VEITDCCGVGKDGKHLQISVAAQTETGAKKVFKCIAFNFGKSIEQLGVGERVDLAFEMLGEVWQGRKNLKLRIIDFRKAI
jgi:hypothetical protein